MTHPYPPTNPYASPYAPVPPPARRWWQHPAVIAVALVVFPPGGIALAWLSRWALGPKIVATVLAGLWFLAPFLGDPPKDDAKPVAAPAPATTSPTPTTAPPTTPPPPVMPEVVGHTFATASATLAPLSLQSVAPAGAYTDVPVPAAPDDWTVCFQSPAADTPLTSPQTTSARLQLAAPGTPCPTTPDTRLHPTATPTPKPTRKPAPAPTPTPTREDDNASGSTGGTGEDDGSSSGGSESAYYKNCTAAREAGVAPIRRGEPGYRSALDRDGDGIACDN
ncbi:excalibur calcium-binding domain-containing protein [Streptomyces sp. SBR177]